jgi:hypothetical protein
MVGLFMSDKGYKRSQLQSILRYTDICFVGLRETMKNINQQVLDFYPGSTIFKANIFT